MSGPEELAKAVVEAADRLDEARRALDHAKASLDSARTTYDHAVAELAKRVGPNTPRRAIVVGARVVLVTYIGTEFGSVDVVDAVVAR